MNGLLTWPAWGTWLAGTRRGWIDPGAVQVDAALPEPDEALSERRRASLKWPAVSLDARQQQIILDDIARIGALRGFVPRIAVVAADHVHLLMDIDERCDVHRTIQLTKGALSRRLSVAAADEPARSAAGDTLAHHKWWTRQYSFRRIEDAGVLTALAGPLLAHRQAAARSRWPDATPPPPGT